MRRLVDSGVLLEFFKRLGSAASEDTRVYLTGGATAVLSGWRESTIDIDIKLVPERDDLLRELPRLKEALSVNVELAAPDQFIPPLEGWEARSPSVAREGKVAFHHYDLHAQALAKLERGHAQDQGDVRAMLERGLIRRDRLLEFLAQIEPLLYRYPAVDPKAFRRAVEAVAAGQD